MARAKMKVQPIDPMDDLPQHHMLDGLATAIQETLSSFDSLAVNKYVAKTRFEHMDGIKRPSTSHGLEREGVDMIAGAFNRMIRHSTHPDVRSTITGVGSSGHQAVPPSALLRNMISALSITVDFMQMALVHIERIEAIALKTTPEPLKSEWNEWDGWKSELADFQTIVGEHLSQAEKSLP
jgi:hypothetical protein